MDGRLHPTCVINKGIMRDQIRREQGVSLDRGIPLDGYCRALRFITPYWPRLVFVLLAGIAGQVLALAIFIDAHSVAALLAARIVQGLAAGTAIGAVGAGMLDVDETRGELGERSRLRAHRRATARARAAAAVSVPGSGVTGSSGATARRRSA